jgi:hypothetical protein
MEKSVVLSRRNLLAAGAAGAAVTAASAESRSVGHRPVSQEPARRGSGLMVVLKRRGRSRGCARCCARQAEEAWS